MKAEELRIGNLIKGIYHDYDDGIDEEIENETTCKVVTLDVSGSGDYPIYVESDEDIEQFSEFQPIPLTEEWLLKFGFKHQNKYDLESNLYSKKLKSEYYFTIYSKTETLDFKTKFIGWKVLNIGFDLKIDYVHQLQNLYFALTGEELTLKP